MTDELVEPCPFCGSKGRIVWPQHSDAGRVKCLNMDCGAEGGIGYTFDEIERRWNTRAAHAVMAAKLEELTPSIFDLLEPLSAALVDHGGPDISCGFARATGGVDIPYVIDAIVAFKVEATLADEVRSTAEDSAYSNEMVGIAVRNWFHRDGR